MLLYCETVVNTQMQLHLVFGLKLYHLGAIPKESCFSKWHLQEQWINTCCNLVIFYWKLHSRSASLQEPSGKVIGLFLNSSLYYKFWAYNNILREDELHILREYELVNYILCFRYAFLMLVITTITSVRMSSLHILGEDELEN